MQHVPSGVLQELQHQREEQVEDKGFGFGAAPGRGGGVSSFSSAETSATSFPFASEDRASSSSPSTPPFFVTSPGAPRESPPTVSGIRRRSGDGSPSEQTIAIQRSVSGSQASPASSRPSTAEAVPSQLLGRRIGTNAELLTPTPDSIERYKSDRLASTTAHLRSLVANMPTPMPLSVSSPVTRVSLPRESPPSHPASRHSDPSISSISSLEDSSSVASSFAFGLRRSKPDLRLFKKKSMPSQHLFQKPSILKLPRDDRRSPSFYKPKVVSDTGVVESTTKDIQLLPRPEKPKPLTLPELLRAEADIKPVRKVQTLRLPDERLKMLRNDSKESKSRPTMQQCASAKDIKMGGQPRQLRFGSPHLLETRSQSPLRPLKSRPSILVAKSTPLLVPRKASVVLSPQCTPTRHYHEVTPPEDEPSVSDNTHFRHGDSYFHTFGADTMYNKEFVPARTPQATVEHSEKARQQRSGSDASHKRTSAVPTPGAHQLDIADTLAPKAKKRKSSALLGIFRVIPIKDVNVFELPSRRKSRRSSSPIPRKTSMITPAATPGIMVSSPMDSNGTQRQSMVPEMTASSYFTRPLSMREDSQISSTPLSPSLSPGAIPVTLTEVVRSRPEVSHQRRRRNRYSSETLSPLGTPRQRQRRIRESTWEGSKEEEGAAALLSRSNPSKVLPNAPVGTRGANSGSRHPLGPDPSVTASPIPNSSPADKQLNTAPAQVQEPDLKKKPSLLKGFYLDIRKLSSIAPFAHDADGTPQLPFSAWARKSSLTLRASFSRVNLRHSISTINVRNGKLAKKSSRGEELLERSDDDENEEPTPAMQQDSKAPEKPIRRITAADLIVTDFFQTPYSQRYYDTQKATQQAIRALVEDTLAEDDDDDDEVVLGFENDVPDHLPSSPLCPLHPKHKSGGKAICLMHGRYKKKKDVAPIEHATRATTHKVEIVFDTREMTELSRKARNSSMGSDGAGSSIPQSLWPIAKSEPTPIRKCVSWRKSKSRESEANRGRKRERGESACDARRRRLALGKRRMR